MRKEESKGCKGRSKEGRGIKKEGGRGEGRRVGLGSEKENINRKENSV